jgi:hypothetical protein
MTLAAVGRMCAMTQRNSPTKSAHSTPFLAGFEVPPMLFARADEVIE